jgi:acyl-CoA synthetase (AMP-forming)/AMP-acid ligase II
MAFTTLQEGFEAVCAGGRKVRYTSDGLDGEAFTFPQLRSRALGLLRNFHDRGLTQGDELILCTPNNKAFIDAFWACQFGGITAVPIAPGMTDEQRGKLFRVFRQLERPYLYTDHGTGARIRALADKLELGAEYQRLKSRTILIENITDLGLPADPVPAKPEDTAFIQFSSGSTSDPKGVVLSHSNLAVNISDIHQATRLGDDDRSLSWMPLTHDMGLIGFHIAMLMRGLDHSIMPTEAFLRRPTIWLQAASRERATLLCSPNFGYRLFLRAFARWQIDDLDLSCVRLIFNGAEPVSATVCEEFMEALSPYGLAPSSMSPVYGLAEATVAVSFPEPATRFQSVKLNRDSLGLGREIVDSEDENSVEIVEVGKPVDHCEVRITDGHDHEYPEGQVGCIEVRGPNVTRGYYGQQHAAGHGSGGHWLDTGDVGFFRQGSLYITGRLKDILFVNGQNYYAHDLEDLACTADGIEPGKVVICGIPDDSGTENIVVFILHYGEAEELAPVASEVRRILGERAGVEIHAAIPVSDIPRTTSGKLKRYALRLAYEAGEYNQVAGVMSAAVEGAAGEEYSELERLLLEICLPSLEGITLHRNDNFFEIGMNSLKLVEIHEQIDQHFPGRLEVPDLFDHPTLARLAAFLDGKLTGDFG